MTNAANLPAKRPYTSDTTDRVVMVGGLRLYTQRRDGGTAPPLVLLHGIGGSLDSWAPLLAEMPDRDIVMVDSPGTGRSDVPWLPIPLSSVAAYIVGAIRALGLRRRVDVLGYSLGGMVAQEVARRYPLLVRRLILVSTGMGFYSRPPSPQVQRALMSPRRYTDPAAAERDVPLLAGGRTARDPAALAEIVAARARHRPSPRGYLYQQLATIGWSSRQWLPDLRMPTLVLQGAEDPVVYVENASMLASRIPNAELEIVPSGGHMMLFDESKKIAAILERFLAH